MILRLKTIIFTFKIFTMSANVQGLLFFYIGFRNKSNETEHYHAHECSHALMMMIRGTRESEHFKYWENQFWFNSNQIGAFNVSEKTQKNAIAKIK